jgi:hypothetical protein
MDENTAGWNDGGDSDSWTHAEIVSRLLSFICLVCLGEGGGRLLV